MEPVATSYSALTPPPTSFLPESQPQSAVADVDTIERWLTSPPKAKTTTTTTTTSTDTVSYASKSPKMSVSEIAMRRRSQQAQQEQQQRSQSTSPQHVEQFDTRAKTTPIPSPLSSDRRSRLLKKQRQQLKQKHGQQKQLLGGNHPTDTDAPGTKNSGTIAPPPAAASSSSAAAAADDGQLTRGRAHKHVSSKSFGKVTHHQNPTDASITTTDAVTPVKSTLCVETNEEKDEKNDHSDETAMGETTTGRLDAKLKKSGTASAGIEAIRRRRQKRLQQRELEEELQELEEEQEQLASTMTNRTIMNTPPHNEDDFNHDGLITPRSSRSSPEVNLSSTATPVSPSPKAGASRTFEFDKNQIHNMKGDNSATHKHIIAVSPHTKIHFLKRHDACVGTTPVSSRLRPLAGKDIIVVDDFSSSQDECKKNDSPPRDECKKSGRLRQYERSSPTPEQYLSLRRQVSRGNNISKREHELEREQPRLSSPSIANNLQPPSTTISPSYVSPAHSLLDLEDQKSSNDLQRQDELRQHYRHSQENDDGLTTLNRSKQDQIVQNSVDLNQCNLGSNTEGSVRDSAVSNKDNTRRIKEAVARTRSVCRDISQYDDELTTILGLPDRASMFQSDDTTCLINSGESGDSDFDRMNISGSENVDATMASSTGSKNNREVGDDILQQFILNDLEATEAKIYVPSLTGSKSRVLDMSVGNDAGTEQIHNHSDGVPRLMKYHPQFKSTEQTYSTSMDPTQNSRTKTSIDGACSTLNHSDKIIPTMEEYAVVIQGGERNRNQDSLANNFGGSGESAIASLVRATTGSTGGSTSAINRRAHERRLHAQEKTNRIMLHVYDLVADDTKLDLWGCHFPLGQVFNAFNSSLHSIGTGAYHVGIEVDGVEYAFGANSTKGLTGVFTCMPKNSPGYQFRTTIDFGDRVLMKMKTSAHRKSKSVDRREILRQMAREYLGTDYDLLRKNCCTFARDACIRLGIDEAEIPSWFHNLAEVGAVTQDAANFTLAPIAQLFSGDQLDTFTEYLNETSLDERAIQDVSSEEKEFEVPMNNTAYQF